MIKRLGFLFLLFLLNSFEAISQEFSATIYLTNNSGEIDSVIIGFDPLATEGIDSTFGEVDISSLPKQAFELRAAQIYPEELLYGEDVQKPRPIKEVVRHETDVQIIPKYCSSFIEGSTESGFAISANLLLKMEQYPVKLSWAKSIFENECVSRSFVTDWPITSWWDIPCCQNLEIDKTFFINSDKILIEKHLGIKLVDETLDTLIMLTVFLNDALGSQTNDKEIINFNISPNPTHNKLHLSTDLSIQHYNITSLSGTVLQKGTSEQTIDVSYLPSGLYFISVWDEDGNSTTERFVKVE